MMPTRSCLVEARASAESVLLITGANGFVGSHLVAALVRRGFQVKALCRGRERASAVDRMRRVLEWHGVALDGFIEVVDGDISKPQLGMSAREFGRLGASVSEIIHCASSTSFAEKNRAEIETTNIDGTRHCLELLDIGRVQHFHQISTAYSMGRSARPCAEALIAPERFNNPYESSKNRAEHLVADACDRANIGWTIYRPSIIIGDSQSGRTLLFNAMYFPVRFFDHMQMMVRRDYVTNSGSNAIAMGAQLAPDGAVLLPLRISLGDRQGGLLNIVPIDFVVDSFLAIYFSSKCHGVYNLTSERCSPLATVTSHIERYYKIRGIRPVSEDVYSSAPANELERAFVAFAEMYLPYMADERQFVCGRIHALPNLRNAASVLEYPVFEKCIDYAVSCGWRSPLRRPRKEMANAVNAID